MMLSMSSSYIGILEKPSFVERFIKSSSVVSLTSTATISVLWVIMSPASRSSNSKMLFIISFWVFSITPFSSPTSTIIRISSSVTISSSAFGSNPKSFTTKFVDTERIFTNGAVIFEMKRSTPTTANETFSGACIAMRLGASSPKTSEK